MIMLIIVPAFISLLLSVGLLYSGIPNAEFYSLYVGLWVPSILSFASVILLANKNYCDKKDN
jgi:hypothetical protein